MTGPAALLVDPCIEALGLGGPGPALASDGHKPHRFTPTARLQSIFCRRLPIESHVRPALIIFPAPQLDEPPRLGDRTEPVQVQAFVAEAAVERLDMCIVGGLAGA